MSTTGSHAFCLHLAQAGLTLHRQVVGRRRRRRGGKKEGKKRDRDRGMAGGRRGVAASTVACHASPRNGGRAD